MFASRPDRKSATPIAAETVLSNEIKLEGTLRSTANVRFDGEMTGNLSTESDLAVDEHGQVQGDVTSRNVVVAGAIRGNVTTSTDGGQTWTSKTIFAPTDGGPTGLSAFIQFANPVVDASSGRLYIPFLHFSNFDADFIKVLVSDDAGATFRFLEFNVPGAPDRFGFPNVTPGTIADCGRNSGGIRLVLHQGSNLGGGRGGLPRFRQSTRLTTQPSAAAAEGRLFLAFNSSTSAVSGDPASRSEIHTLFSPDGGATFVGPITVAAATDRDPQHVFPSLSIDEEGQHVDVAYYVQQADGKLRVDVASGEVDDRALRIDREKVQRVSSVAFDLIPSNNPLPIAGNPFFTTNYDRTVRACYNLGEYIATTVQDGRVLAAWGDNRNPWTSPAGSPAAGTHAQPDVFFQRLGAGQGRRPVAGLLPLIPQFAPAGQRRTGRHLVGHPSGVSRVDDPWPAYPATHSGTHWRRSGSRWNRCWRRRGWRDDRRVLYPPGITRRGRGIPGCAPANRIGRIRRYPQPFVKNGRKPDVAARWDGSRGR